MSVIALVTTTINVPELLYAYARDAREHDQAVKIYVAGDQHTQAGAADCCAFIARRTGIECEYLDPAAQDRFLAPWPKLREHLPWNCIQRRNVAVLKAVRDGAATVVTIDDDNFLAEDNYFAHFTHVGSWGDKVTLPAYGRPGEWFNVCRFLETANHYQFVPRGYGMSARGELDDGTAAASGPALTMPVSVVAGLWLGDPDIDAATRLAHPIEVTRYLLDHNFFLAPGARRSLQLSEHRTSACGFTRLLSVAACGRFDDIFASFIVKRIADHLGWGVSFGRPLARQERNAHDLLHDFDMERMGMRYVDDFTTDLAKTTLKGEDFASCALEICEQLERAEQSELADFFFGYRIWAELPVWH